MTDVDALDCTDVGPSRQVMAAEFDHRLTTVTALSSSHTRQHVPPTPPMSASARGLKPIHTATPDTTQTGLFCRVWRAV